MTPDLMRHIHVLAEEIGPRGSTTLEEAAAAAYVEAEMKQHVPRVWQQTFHSFTSFSWPYLVVFGTCLLGALAVWVNGPTALILGLAGAVLYVLQNSQAIELGDLFPRRGSQNVIGQVPGQGDVQHHVVFVAHLDTQRAADNFKPSAVPMFRASFLAMTAAAGAAPLLGLLQILWPSSWWAYISLVPTAILAFAAWSLIRREWKHTYTHGANDNASGVAVLLGLAEQFGRHPLLHTQVWLVASGCEEVGSTGMKAFLARYSPQLKDADFIILDNHGAGHVRFTEYEGMLRRLRSHPDLLRVAKALARSHPELGVAGGAQVLMPTDATQALRRGHRALALLAYDDEGLLPNWHWYTDTAENVQPETLQQAFLFACYLATALDALVGPGAMPE